MIKKITGIVLALMLLTISTACADSAVDVIMNTGTTQAFTDEAVPSADLETILRAGLSTESAINQQPWFFAAVTNPEMMQEIAGAGMGGFTPPAGTGDKPEGAPAGGTDGFPGGAPEGAPEGMPQNAPGGRYACRTFLWRRQCESIAGRFTGGATTREALETKTSIIE